MNEIPFNRPQLVGREYEYITEALERLHLSAGGMFTERCASWLESRLGCRRAILTTSCTGALEMIALLLEIEPGDEVIMPSYTFVSTANAFALRGGVPVFVDIRSDTLNIDEHQVAEAVTERTRAIVAVHYAGVPCEMDALEAIAVGRSVAVVEDAAQALLSSYRDRPAGSIGALAATSFHETKNVTCGEGGALLVNDPALLDRAEVIRDKGTDRTRFLRGHVDKYSWVDLGSSYGLSEINAAFLLAQLEVSGSIARDRRSIWALYHEAFEDLESRGVVRRPSIPAGVVHNGHLYYLLVKSLAERSRLLEGLSDRGVRSVFHYVPLHSSVAGRRYGRAHGELSTTQTVSDTLVRLPLWGGMTERDVARVADAVHATLGARRSPRAHSGRMRGT